MEISRKFAVLAGLIVLLLLQLLVPLGASAEQGEEVVGAEEFQKDWKERRRKFRELRRQYCSENPDDERCRRMKERRERRKFCKNNPKDEQCIAWKKKREERRAELMQECRQNPEDQRCDRWMHRYGKKKHSPDAQ